MHLPHFIKDRYFKIFLKLAQYLIMGAAILWMVRLLFQNWQKLGPQITQMKPEFVVQALILNLLMLLLMPAGWAFALRIMGEDFSMFTSFQIYYQTSILKYLPGSIWNFPGRGYLAQKQGISPARFMQSLFLEQIFLLGTGSVIASWRISSYLGFPWLFPVALIGFVLVIGSIIFFPDLVPVRWPEIFHLKIRNYWAIVAILLNYLAVWFFYGVEVYLLIGSFPNSSNAPVWNIIINNTVAWLVGFVSFVPVGLGVREITLTALLGEALAATAVVASLAQRILETLLEFGLWFIARFFCKKGEKL